MSNEFHLTLSDLEIGKKYVLSARPDSICYVNESGYVQDDSLFDDDKRLMISVDDLFKRYDPRQYLNIKVGDMVKFYGNKVKIGWIDHSYIAIDFIDQKSEPRIAINCPKGKFKSQHYEWVNEMTCFQPL